MSQFQWSAALVLCCLVAVSQKSIGAAPSAIAESPIAAAQSKIIVEKPPANGEITQVLPSTQLAQPKELNDVMVAIGNDSKNVEYNLPIPNTTSVCSFKLPADFRYEDSNEMHTNLTNDNILVHIFHSKTDFPTPKSLMDKLISAIKNGEVLMKSLRNDGFKLLTVNSDGVTTYTNVLHINGISCGIDVIYAKSNNVVTYTKNMINDTIRMKEQR
jgi:hypothetical protein